ncbi:MAG: rRNA maturation RNase YbeY [Candidatus Izemoplasmatales bacterium]|jgi:probable rRNA maturation factor|nr:rRNA maturation RNase YbeY [Candidatus Izemoplasmatales bacterium]
MLKINVFNQYNDEDSYKQVITKVMKQAYKTLKMKKSSIINVILITNEAIHLMNLQYRSMDRPTDVLSFENNEDDLELGDVFISIDKVTEQANIYEHSFERELAFLSCHGFLHCVGYDHQSIEQEKEMFALQDEILDQTAFTR